MRAQPNNTFYGENEEKSPSEGFISFLSPRLITRLSPAHGKPQPQFVPHPTPSADDPNC